MDRAKESEVVQTLLMSGQIDQAERLARGCIERLRKISPFHAAYAETTLSIEKKEFQKALEASVGLKERMDQSPEVNKLKGKNLKGGSTLYASNLLRIALLQRQVGNSPGELSGVSESGTGSVSSSGSTSTALQSLSQLHSFSPELHFPSPHFVQKALPSLTVAHSPLLDIELGILSRPSQQN